jgi:photosystem II stability/assembly factor-like uncharacterized protein
MYWWALGDGSVFKSADAGQTWQVISSMAPRSPANAPVELHVFDAQHAWAQVPILLATFAGGVQTSSVMMTSDGGHTWTSVAAPQVSWPVFPSPRRGEG